MNTEDKRFLVSLLAAMILAVAMLAGLFLVAKSSDAAQSILVPSRIAVTPGEAKTGQALMVSFWGASPLSTVTVTVGGAEFWKCDDGQCAPGVIQASTLLVQSDTHGHGYFAIGVPCGYPPGLLWIDVGGRKMSIPVVEGNWCKTHSDWLKGVR